MKTVQLVVILALCFCSETYADSRIIIQRDINGISYNIDTLNHVLYVEGKGFDYGSSRVTIDDSLKNLYRKYLLDTRKIVFGKDIEGIADYAYQGLQLEEVVFTGNSKVIRRAAFADCEKLESVVLPSKMRSIGDNAFENCIALSEVKFPQALDSLGADAFAKTALKEVFLPQNLRYIGREALAGLKINSVRLPDSLRALPAGLFLFSEIRELYIPSTVKYIEPMAFAGIFGIKRVYLNWTRPEDVDVSVTSLDYSGMDSLEFVVPDGTFDLYYEKLCYGFHVPSTCRVTEQSAFANKGDFRWRLEGKTLMVDNADFNYVSNTECDYFDGKLKFEKVKKMIINEGIIRLPYSFFFHFPNVEDIQLPASLQEIAKDGLLNKAKCTVSPANPFYSVQNGFLFDKRDSSIVLFLKNQKVMNIPAYVKSIRSSAFYRCCFDSVCVDERNPYFAERENVLFSKNFDTLYFYSCSRKQKEYIIPESVTTIGDYAFGGMENLENVQFGRGVRRIGNSAFIGAGLLKVVLPPSVEYIDREAFSYNSQLAYVDLSSTKIKELNAGLFYKCGKLTNALLPNGLETIWPFCFQDAKHLTTIDLPKSLKCMIGPFDGSGIKTLYIPDNVIWFYAIFSPYTKIKDVYLNWSGGNVYNDIYIKGNEYRNCDMTDGMAPVKLHVADEKEWDYWKNEWQVDVVTNGRVYLK